MVADLVFMMATLEIVFGRKKLLDAKGLFGVSVLKNPARYTYLPYQITRTISDQIALHFVQLA